METSRSDNTALAAIRSDSELPSTERVYHFGRAKIETQPIMKPVIQLEETGCGIASVAALAGVSYTTANRVANSMGISATDSRLWSETTYVCRLLRYYRLHSSASPTPFVSWEALPNRALLAIKWHREGRRAFWHWVVFVRESGGTAVLDSKKMLKHHVRKDLWRMKPKWFIEVHESHPLNVIGF